MPDDPNTPKRPQRQAALDFADKLPHLTGTARPTASNSQGIAANPSTSSTTTTQPTSITTAPTQSPNASPNRKGKRKAADEAPDHATQPEPLSKRMKTSATSAEEIMSRPYDQLSSTSQQTVWLRTALSTYGAGNFDDDLTVSDLEDLYNEIIDDPDADADNDMPPMDTGVYTGSTTPMSRGQKLSSTDHTTFDAVYAETPRDQKGKPDLSGLAHDDKSQPTTQVPPPSPTTTAVHADNRHPPAKVPASRVKDLRRAALERTQRQANAVLKGGTSTTVNKVSQGTVGAFSRKPVASPPAAGMASHANATSTPSRAGTSFSHGLVMSRSASANMSSSRIVPAALSSSTPGASSLRSPVVPSGAVAAASSRGLVVPPITSGASSPRPSATSSPRPSAASSSHVPAASSSRVPVASSSRVPIPPSPHAPATS
ncbi:hypothetical protein FRC10_010906, partial [Ceratobasidium sp. 414]